MEKLFQKIAGKKGWESKGKNVSRAVLLIFNT